MYRVAGIAGLYAIGSCVAPGRQPLTPRQIFDLGVKTSQPAPVKPPSSPILRK